MTKKIGILTFHASHNFGSMLQAFALQKILEQMGCTSEIINFRSVVQRKNFSGVWHLPVNSLYALMRKCVLFPWRQDFITKYNKFEDFLQNNLVHTAQYNTEEEVLENSPKYDFYIAGSDQIWNSTAMDFSWLYFLPFKTGKKIAYAPSAGDQALLPQNKEKMLDLLSQFNAISVREAKLANVLGKLLPTKPQVVLDPTLLIPAEQWAKYIAKTPLVGGGYLLLYSPFRRTDLLDAIPSEKKHYKIVMCYPSDIKALFNPRFTKRFDTGPWDFLNLIYYSKGVISGSFHAAVFAKLFNKPLYCVDMGPGSRIANLEEKFKHLEEERAKSMQFLKEALQ